MRYDNQIDSQHVVTKPEIILTPTPGKFVVLLFGESGTNVETSNVVEVKTTKSMPNYPDVIPKQKIISVEKKLVAGREVGFVVKAYIPAVIEVEASLVVDDILSDGMIELKRLLLNECRKELSEYGCNPKFDEEYSVYCVAGHGDGPEICLTMYGDRIAALLKNERMTLDDEEVSATLSAYLKYGKDDMTIVDWDGAFIFDPSGDFASNLELIEIANFQLLKSRILVYDLDDRLEKALRLMRDTKRIPMIRSREVRKVLREIIELRTLSILESEAVERNIKLIGDWYSAKFYSLISKKFHLESWKREIREKLDTLEDVYTMASENFSVSYRSTLELVILGGWFVLLLLYVGEFLLTRK